MSTQQERTNAFIADLHRPRYAPLHDAPAIYAERVDALHGHARELALRLDAVMEFATAFLSEPYEQDIRKIVAGEGDFHRPENTTTKQEIIA